MSEWTGILIGDGVVLPVETSETAALKSLIAPEVEAQIGLPKGVEKRFATVAEIAAWIRTQWIEELTQPVGNLFPTKVTMELSIMVGGEAGTPVFSIVKAKSEGTVKLAMEWGG